MTVLQPQGRQEGTQTRWATWKGVGSVVGLPWTPLLSCVVLAGQTQLEARGPLGGACRMTPKGSGQGLRWTSGISPGKEVFPVLEKEVTAIHPVNQHGKEVAEE